MPDSDLLSKMGSDAGSAAEKAGPELLNLLVNRAHPNIKFFVEIDGIEIASFSSCSGVSVEVETFSYQEGGLNSRVHTLPTRVKYGPITLKRGMNFGTELYDWFMKCLKAGAQPDRKNVVIKIYGHLPWLVLREITLVGAWPTKYTGADLTTENGATAVESIEFSYDQFLYGGKVSSAGSVGPSVTVLP